MRRGNGRLSETIAKKSNQLNITNVANEAVESITPEYQVEELPPPFTIDDTVLVIWDDGRDGVCHYIPIRDLRLKDRSRPITYGTRVSYRARNRIWGGHIPASISELIECCCMKSALVELRTKCMRQVLVLWDNPSAGACHYMYTKDLRIIDDSSRIRRGTRVAFYTRRNITWTGQVPPAIYDDRERGSFSLMGRGNFREDVKRMQKMVNNWFPSGIPDEFNPVNSAYAMIDGFWERVNSFCRDLSGDDLTYIESLLNSYQNRSRIRSRIFMKHQRHFLASRLADNHQSLRLENTKLSDPMDIIGMESTISDSTSTRSSVCAGGTLLNSLHICVNGTESSPPSCHSLVSSIPESDYVAANSSQDNNNLPETDKIDEESLSAFDDIAEKPAVIQSTVRRRSSSVRKEEEHNGQHTLSSDEILDRLSCRVGDFTTVGEAIIKKYSEQFPIIPSDIEDFFTSDESFDTDISNSSEDEVYTLMRKKQSELICLEAKNKRVLQSLQKLMKQSFERQKIEKRLRNTDKRITELTGSMLRYLRLKQRTKARLKMQHLREKDEAKTALLERRRIIKELSDFDSKCPETFLTLS